MDAQGCTYPRGTPGEVGRYRLEDSHLLQRAPEGTTANITWVDGIPIMQKRKKSASPTGRGGGGFGGSCTGSLAA